MKFILLLETFYLDFHRYVTLVGHNLLPGGQYHEIYLFGQNRTES